MCPGSLQQINFPFAVKKQHSISEQRDGIGQMVEVQVDAKSENVYVYTTEYIQ